MYPVNDYRDYLIHHGIAGMKWGIRNGPPYPLSYSDYSKSERAAIQESKLSRDEKLAIKDLNGAKTSNLDQWGKTPDTNVLYVAGYSGSGKSTVALGLKRNNDTIIHLDAYSEKSTELSKLQSKRFNRYLDSKGVDYKSIIDRTRFGLHSDEYWKEVDKLAFAIEDFGKKEFKNGNRVICEGVQIADNWLTNENNNYREFVGKPVIVLNTNPVSSSKRAFERDGRGDNVLKAFMTLDDKSGYVKWQVETNKKLNALSKATNASKNGRQYVYLIYDKDGSR